MNPREQKITLREKLAYGSGDIAINFYLQVIGMYLIVFYTDVLGIGAALAGIIAMGSRLFDALNDLVIGYLSDRYGNFKKWIFWGCVGSSVTFVLMFLSPGLNVGMSAVYATVTFCIFTVVYSVYAIPYNAMASTITADTQERTSLNSVRFALTTLPVVAVSVGMPLLLEYISKSASVSRAYLLCVTLFAVLGIGTTIICVRGTKERIKAEPTNEKLSLRDVFAALGENKPLRILSIAFFLRNLGYYTFSGALVYFFDYYMMNSTLLSVFMLILVVFSVIGMLLVPFLTAKFGKKAVFIGGGLLMAASCAGIFIAPGNLAVLFVLGCIAALGMGAPLVTSFAMVSDTVEYGRWHTGKPARSINFSVFIFSQKIGISVSSFLVGTVLSLCGYAANAVQSDTSLFGILLLMTLIPAVITIAMSLVMLRWNLSESRMESILLELEKGK